MATIKGDNIVRAVDSNLSVKSTFHETKQQINALAAQVNLLTRRYRKWKWTHYKVGRRR